MKPLDTPPALPTERVKIIERIVGKLLYYSRGVNVTCLLKLRKMVTRNEPIEKYEKNVHQLLDYMATNPNALVIFHASDMILHADTDASYLTKPEACSRPVRLSV